MRHCSAPVQGLLWQPALLQQVGVWPAKYPDLRHRLQQQLDWAYALAQSSMQPGRTGLHPRHCRCRPADKLSAPVWHCAALATAYGFALLLTC